MQPTSTSKENRTGFTFLCSDPVFKRELASFAGYKRSACSIGAVMLVYSSSFILLLICCFLTLSYEEQYPNGDMLILLEIEALLSFLCVLSGILLFLCQLSEQMPTWLQWMKCWKPYRCSLQRCTMFSAVIVYSIQLIHRVYNGKCDESHEGKGKFSALDLHCNPNEASHSLPADTTFLLLATPVLFATIVRETCMVSLLIAWAIGPLTVIATLVFLPENTSLPLLIPLILLSLMVIVDTVRHNTNIFYLQRELQDVIDANEISSKEEYQNEVRNLIGNVAHDLKTPLSSFMTGIDLLSSALADFQSLIHNVAITTNHVEVFTDQLESTLGNIRDTNAFMLMTINRCIDYTKASKGLKLTPKYDTINLEEALQLPLSCMKNIQDKVSIEMVSLSPNLCSHVITDKQWLQENVLCLLSNAVKYSSGGEVTLTVSLFELSNPESMVETRKRPDDSRRSEIGSSSLIGYSNNRVLPSIMSLNEEDSFHSNADSSITTNSLLSATTTYLMFEVEDHGIGVPSSQKDQLFNPFKQTQKLAGGTGLGLYSLAKRVEALHGKYGVKERKDGAQGSLFWFSIPYKPDQSAEEIQVLDSISTSTRNFNNFASHLRNNIEITLNASFANTVTSMDYSSELQETNFNSISVPLKILLTEDSPTVAKMTKLMLSKGRHEIVHVENGEQAVKLMHHQINQSEVNNSFDVILMDLQMPIMDGIEATRRIRALESSTVGAQRQLIIGLSANSSPEDIDEADASLFDAFLSKPFNINTFYEYLISRKQQ